MTGGNWEGGGEEEAGEGAEEGAEEGSEQAEEYREERGRKKGDILKDTAKSTRIRPSRAEAGVVRLRELEAVVQTDCEDRAWGGPVLAGADVDLFVFSC